VNPTDRTRRPTPATFDLAAVYGGGGLFGIGYGLGIASTLIDEGVDLASASALGTSAGSWVAAGVVLGISFSDAIGAIGGRIPRVPDPRPGRLRDIAADLVGADTRCPTVRVGVCELPRLRHVVLDGAHHPMPELVAASSAVPGLLAPQRIGGSRYVDGGVRSMAAIDRAPNARRLLVVLPLSGPMFGPAGRLIERGIGRELAAWQRANPSGETIVVRPTPEIARLARRPDHLFDTGRAVRCHELARQQGHEVCRQWKTTD
jgi:hypothetical protein